MQQLASAMNYLHCLDPPIAHRDLKTPNILLDGLDVLKVRKSEVFSFAICCFSALGVS